MHDSLEIDFQTRVNPESAICLPAEDFLYSLLRKKVRGGRPPDDDESPCDPSDDEHLEPTDDRGDMMPGGGHGTGDVP